MERDREQVRQEIEEKKEAMAEKLEEITDRVDEARDKLRDVRRKISLRYQVREHPWMTLGLSVAAGYTLYRVVHARPMERAMTRALRGVRGTARGVTGGAKNGARMAGKVASGAARKARDSGKSMTDMFDGSALARGIFNALTRAAMTTVGGMVIGGLIERLRSDDEEENKGEEVIYEQKTNAPTAATVRTNPLMG